VRSRPWQPLQLAGEDRNSEDLGGAELARERLFNTDPKALRGRKPISRIDPERAAVQRRVKFVSLCIEASIGEDILNAELGP